MAKQTYTVGQTLTAAQMTQLQADVYSPTVSIKTASYILVAADAGTRVEMNVGTANTVTVNTSLFTAGDTLIISNKGAGQTTITAGTATVSSAGLLTLDQYANGELYFVSAGVAIWTGAGGDLTAITAGTGISVASSTGPVPTVSIDTATTVDKTTAQTLTNKTLTSPVLTTPTISTIDAKGDLLAGTADNTVDRIAVGSDGESLVADSSTSTGLRWQGDYAAGKNAVINSNFNIWQRGTSIAATGGSGVYTADRWSAYNASYTVSQQDTSDTTNLPFISKCARVIRRVGETSVAGANFVQPLETVNTKPFIGKTATVSFYARAGANYSSASGALLVYLLGGTGTDQNPNNTYTGQTSVISQTATLTTTWQRFSYTTGSTIGTTVNELAVQFTSVGVGTAGAADYFEVTGVQLEIGSVATAYSPNAATIQGELAACQRYFVALPSGSASDNYATFATGYTATTTKGNFVVNLPVPMRIYPTMTYSAGNTFATHTGASTVTAGTAIATDRSSPNTIWCNLTVASGLTAGNALFLIGNNTTSAKIEASAEL